MSPVFENDSTGGVFSEDERLDADSTLLTRDVVWVQNRRRVIDAHGGHYVDDGDPIRVICNVEGRAQQAGQFSISGAESKRPQDQGGLTEVTPVQILARTWPGNIHSLVWIHPLNPDLSEDTDKWDKYDADGAPVARHHGTKKAVHWEIRARRVVDSVLSPVPIVPPELPDEGGF